MIVCFVFSGLKEMYVSETLCDVAVLTSDKRFLCHRVVLASVSPYFKALFTCPMKESTRGEVCLSDVPSSTMQAVLHYIYTGEARLTLDNVEELFIVSGRLQVAAVQDLCSSYLAKRIDNGNCLWIYRLAHSHHHRILLEATVNYIGRNLSFFSRKEDFLHLELEELATILSSDNLMVSSELDVYNVARGWWEFHTKKDNPLPTELLKAIRIPLLNPDELEKVGGDVPSDDSAFRCPARIHLRQGMFEERIICMDVMALEETDPEEEDYYMNAYDPTTDSWEKLPFVGCLDNAGIVSVGCCLYVSGGFGEEHCASNALRLYDSVLNEWKELASMAHPRAYHGFLACGNALYAFGGCNKHELTDSVECFSVSDNSWRSVSSMPLALHSFTSAVLKGKLFVIGGMTKTGVQLLHYPGFHIYDPLTDAWSKFPLPVVFSGAGAVTMDDQIYIIASYETRRGDGCAYPAHDAYPPYDDYKAYLLYHEQPNTTSKSFCMDHLGRICHGTIPPVLKSVSGSAVVRWKHRIYIVGGSDDDGMSHYKMFHWSPGEPRWTLCKKELTFLFASLESVSLQVPLKHLSSIIPGRRSNYNFGGYSDEENESQEEPYWGNW
ncbi:PREDICTED: kelch-like protein diablo [Nanorana parkeri]|uniref:kelch-like protein diablo n=1 Tax=Nanorana parkeri TaxID=125878 RepID=UPI000854491F|nr:PREDICTED: kelch-like protein diablo [Nanorana parkeri]